MGEMGQVVIIVDTSAGNESVGEMWKETKIFNDDATLKNVVDWVKERFDGSTRKNITITVPNV